MMKIKVFLSCVILVLALSSCEKELTDTDVNTQFYGQWELTRISGGFAPVEKFNDSSIIWKFNASDSVQIFVCKPLEGNSRVPFKSDTVLSYSYDSVNLSIGNYAFEYRFQDSLMILIDELSSDGLMLEFEKKDEN